MKKKIQKNALQTLRSTTRWDQPAASRIAVDVEFATSLIHKNDVSFVSGLLTGVNVMFIVYIWSILAQKPGELFVTTINNIEEENEVLIKRNVLALIYFSLGLPLLLANLMCIAMHVWVTTRSIIV